jgi:hypothetical protein
VGAHRAAALTVVLVLAAASPAAARPGNLGTGHDPGVAVDAAGTAHVAWLADAGAGGVLEYCRVPRGERACASRTQVPLEDDGFGKVQVMLPAPGVVQILAPLLDPSPLLTSVDGGVTFARRDLFDLPAIESAFYGPGNAISIMSGSGPASYGRFAPDGSGPDGLPVTLADLYDSLDTTLAPWGNGLVALFAGSGGLDAALWNGLGDPNLQQSWVPGPFLGENGNDPSAAAGRSGTFVAYVLRRGRKTGLYVRRLRSSGTFGRAKRLTRRDPVDFMLVQGPKGNLAVVYSWSDDGYVLRSRKGTRWTRSKRLWRGGQTTDVRAVMGRRGGWVVWDGSGGNAGTHPIRIGALPGAPRR